MNTYSDALRDEGVQMVAAGATLAATARHLGATPGAVSHWVRRARRSENLQRVRPALEVLAPGTRIAGVIIVRVLGRVARPGVYAPLTPRRQDQLDRVCYSVRCAVCGAGITPTSHKRLMALAAEMDVVNCVACWKLG